MAFNRPSMPQLVERVTTDIDSRLPGSDARLRRSNLGVLSRVAAGVAHGLYGFIAWVAKQIIPDTAEGDYLDRWASIWVGGRIGATVATGEVTLTGVHNTLVPAGTILKRADGAEYRTTADTTILSGTATAPVTAEVAGVDGNALVGVKLSLAAQTLGASATATVAAVGLTGGTDIESDDSLRERMLFRIRQPPQGGAAHDYEAWAREVAGVTRVWVKPDWLGPNTVGVFFVRDGDTPNIPDAAEVASVQAHVAVLKPITAAVTALAPTPLPVAISISISPDTAAVRAAVESELLNVFRIESEPGGTILASHLREAVSLAAGEIDHTIDVPVGDVVAGPGQMPELGVITWL